MSAESAASRCGLARLLSSPPWKDGIERWTYHPAPMSDQVDAVIAIPALDEEAPIETCLGACARSAAVSELRVRLIVIVNNTSDRTVDRALAWSAREGYSLTLIDVDFLPHLACAGIARRLALDIASLEVEPSTLLMTTDADAKPAPEWVSNNAALLHAGAGLVCGRIFTELDDTRFLPADVRKTRELERRYRHAALAVENCLDRDPWNPWPHHGTVSGASLAIRAGQFARVAGRPVLSPEADRVLADRVRAHGLPLVHANSVEVEVSHRPPRHVGNNTEDAGMADALQERPPCENPYCNEELEPAAALFTRLGSRIWLRSLWPESQRRYHALLTLEASPSLAITLARLEDFAPAWAALEQAIYVSARKRLRLNELRHELHDLLTLLDDDERQTDDARQRLLHMLRGLTERSKTLERAATGKIRHELSRPI